MLLPSHLAAAFLAAEGWRSHRAVVLQAPADHPARTAPLSGTLDGSATWLGWIEDDARTWVAFIDRANAGLLWTSRDATGGVLGSPAGFQRDIAKDNGDGAVHVDKPVGAKAEMPVPGPTPRPLAAGPSPMQPSLKVSTVDLLSPLVANGIAMTLAAQHAHWNLRGASFGPLHQLFGKLYSALAGHTDRLAERIATLGGVAPGALELVIAIVASSKVIEPMTTPDGQPNEYAFVEYLANRLDAYIASLATAYGKTDAMGEVATTNALADVQEDLEKFGWKLRAHLQ